MANDTNALASVSPAIEMEIQHRASAAALQHQPQHGRDIIKNNKTHKKRRREKKKNDFIPRDSNVTSRRRQVCNYRVVSTR